MKDSSTMSSGNLVGNARFVGVPPSQGLLQSLPYLDEIPHDVVADLLLPNARVVEFAAGDELTRQDDAAQYVFFLLSGTVRVTRIRRDQPDARAAGAIVRVASSGDIIGRYELTFSLRYISTAAAENGVKALCIDRSTLERLLYRYPNIYRQTIYQKTVNRLRTLPLLSDVDGDTLGFLAEETESSTVEANTVIYTQNQAPDTLFLIAQGQVELYHPRRMETRLLLGSGGCFGFPGSVGAAFSAPHDRYGHWAEAQAETTLLALPWRTVRQIGPHSPQAIDPEMQLLPAKTISAVPVLAGLTPVEQILLAGFCSFHHIPQFHPILQQGDSADSMWILLENSRAVLSALDDESRALPRAPVRGIVTFNDAALLGDSNVELTVESEPGSLWLRLHRQDFRHFCHLCGPAALEKIAARLPEFPDDTEHRQRQDYGWLRKGELLVRLYLRHWLALTGHARPALICVLASAGLVWLSSFLSIPLWVSLGLGALLVALTLIWGFLNYLNDYFIVTNRRVIQQEKVIFFSEQRREALLEQIQRVDVATSFWGNLFNYGSVSVFTAGTTGSIDFDIVSDPDNLRAAIFHQRSLCQQRSSAESKLDIQNALENRLGLSVDLPSRVRSDTVQDEPEPPQANQGIWQRLRRTATLDSSHEREGSGRVVWHKHWWVLFAQLVLPGLLLLCEIFLLGGGLSSYSVVQKLVDGMDQTTYLLCSGALVLVTLGWILWAIADWWNDTYTVTQDRIIDVEKLPLFLSEQRREAQLSDIQDIRLEMNSPLNMMLNFGNIIVQTAAGEGAFTFDHVPNPRFVKEEITRRMIAWRREDERRKAQDRSRDLPDWFEMYNRLETGQSRGRD